MSLGGVLDLLGGVALGASLTLIIAFMTLLYQRNYDHRTNKQRLRDAKRRRLRKAYIRLGRVAVSARELKKTRAATSAAGPRPLWEETDVSLLVHDLRMDVESAKLAVLLELPDLDAEQAFTRLDSVLADFECHARKARYAPEVLLKDHDLAWIVDDCDELVSAFDYLLAIARDQLADLELRL